MAARILRYFADGNTALGFYSLFESNLQGLRRIFILKGGPGTGKSSLMNAIGTEWAERGYDIELIHCSSDKDSIDGVIIPALGVSIVDGTAPHVIEPKAPGAARKYVNLGEVWDSAALISQREIIEELNRKAADAYAAAYSRFAEALNIHDEWEKIYFEHMDFGRADQLTALMLEQLFGEAHLQRSADVKHRFLGAATPAGSVDFVPNLTEGLWRRFFLKGRAGTGKSTILRTIASEAEKRGFDTEIYHCGFDPHSLDMVIVRELDFAIFDSTSPHEYYPEREGDVIVDTYEAVVAPGTDERLAGPLEEVSTQYKATMKTAIAALAEAKVHRDELKKIYIAAIDFSVVDAARKRISAELASMQA
ncbi:PRK06851 family protein [Paenibacillus tritici]|uniref:PRK06851 family protein n=1 Tax=Paenibacillus tritici TaxID=1873425 RepID=UPI001BAB6C28|nr:PRK06851 family protein [Paenibacillus tritici]QUL57905.1 PRK06851 family protein [Paenibacillus tritici]